LLYLFTAVDYRPVKLQMRSKLRYLVKRYIELVGYESRWDIHIVDLTAGFRHTSKWLFSLQRLSRHIQQCRKRSTGLVWVGN